MYVVKKVYHGVGGRHNKNPPANSISFLQDLLKQVLDVGLARKAILAKLQSDDVFLRSFVVAVET